MKALAALAAMSLCACVTTRTFTPTPYVALQQPPLTSRWALTKLAVSPPTNPALALHDFSPGVQQLELHVRDALTHDPALGHFTERADQADYVVELDLHLDEGAAPNGWYAAGLGTAVVLPYGGAGIGLIAGGLASVPAGLVGAAVGGAVALVVTAAMPMETYRGHLVADVVVRRARDGVAIASRNARVAWTAMVSTFGATTQLANAAGAAVPDLEHQVAERLTEVFATLPPERLAQAPGS